MSRVTSKLQVTVPKAIAARYGIEPGDEIEWAPAGEVIRVIPPGQRRVVFSTKERLRLFDRATERQAARDRERPSPPVTERGWTREDLHDRGRPR